MTTVKLIKAPYSAVQKKQPNIEIDENVWENLANNPLNVVTRAGLIYASVLGYGHAEHNETDIVYLIGFSDT